MTVFRIAKQQFIDDLSGEGARRFGGRWNRKGIGVLYTSESRSLATVEYLVHLSMGILPKDLAMAEVEIPDDATMDSVDVSALPPDWARFPAPMELADLGTEWVNGNKTLGLRIPSAVVKAEWNVLLNPNHPLFSQVKIVSVDEFAFDQRLLKRRPEPESQA